MEEVADPIFRVQAFPVHDVPVKEGDTSRLMTLAHHALTPRNFAGIGDFDLNQCFPGLGDMLFYRYWLDLGGAAGLCGTLFDQPSTSLYPPGLDAVPSSASLSAASSASSASLSTASSASLSAASSASLSAASSASSASLSTASSASLSAASSASLSSASSASLSKVSPVLDQQLSPGDRYWSTLSGINTSLTRFERKPENPKRKHAGVSDVRQANASKHLWEEICASVEGYRVPEHIRKYSPFGTLLTNALSQRSFVKTLIILEEKGVVILDWKDICKFEVFAHGCHNLRRVRVVEGCAEEFAKHVASLYARSSGRIAMDQYVEIDIDAKFLGLERQLWRSMTDSMKDTLFLSPEKIDTCRADWHKAMRGEVDLVFCVPMVVTDTGRVRRASKKSRH